MSDGERIRLWGIDAPESDQLCQRDGPAWRCGNQARAALLTLVDSREITSTGRGVDRYREWLRKTKT